MDETTSKLDNSTEAFIDKQYENARDTTLKKEIMEEVKFYVKNAVISELEVHKMTMEDSFKFDRPFSSDSSEFLQHRKSIF